VQDGANPELSEAVEGSLMEARLSQRLLLRDGGRILCIPVEEIEWVEAAGNYVEIHMGRKSHLVRHTVKAMEAKLDPDRFLRVRPSAIVNVNEVATLESRSGGDYLLTLRNGVQIPSSRSFRDRVEEVFGKPMRRRRRRAIRFQ
jgi:two-component system LytT family response regulator